MRFAHSFRVNQEAIDEQGHVNNVTVVRWIQDVAVAHWRHSATEDQKEKYTWVVVRHEIDYKDQAFEGQTVTAETWVGEWTKVTCERFTEMRRGEQVLAKGRTLWCMVDRSTGRPTRIPKSLKDRFID